MGSVASDLKSEREKRKISLAQISAETRISLRHLESLEEGRYRDLPGGMYNRAFLKAYCEFLKLDVSDVMERYENEVSPVFEKPLKTKAHIPQQSSSFRISPVVIWGVLLLISGAGLFFSRKWVTAIFSPYFSHTPAETVRYEPVQPAKPVPKPVETQPPVVDPPVQTPVQSEAAVPEPAATLPVPASPAATVPGPVAGAVTVGGSSPAVPAAPPDAAHSDTLHLQIKATDKCWISVNRDGSQVLRKVMEPGEIQSFNASEKLELIVGNAGGIHLTVNGKPAKPLGKPGEVVKVLIDEKNLQSIQEQTTG